MIDPRTSALMTNRLTTKLCLLLASFVINFTFDVIIYFDVIISQSVGESVGYSAFHALERQRSVPFLGKRKSDTPPPSSNQ